MGDCALRAIERCTPWKVQLADLICYELVPSNFEHVTKMTTSHLKMLSIMYSGEDNQSGPPRVSIIAPPPVFISDVADRSEYCILSERNSVRKNAQHDTTF
jgi:hypothetical protein